MVKLLECGHPDTWTFRLTGFGKRFTYCLGCLIEKTGLENVESYDNPAIKHKRGDEKCQDQDTGKKTVRKKVGKKVEEEETEQVTADTQKPKEEEPKIDDSIELKSTKFIKEQSE